MSNSILDGRPRLFFLASSSLSLLPLADSKSRFFCRDSFRSFSFSLRVFFFCSRDFMLIPGRPFRCQHSSRLYPVFLQCLQNLFIAFTRGSLSGFGSAYLLLRQSRQCPVFPHLKHFKVEF